MALLISKTLAIVVMPMFFGINVAFRPADNIIPAVIAVARHRRKRFFGNDLRQDDMRIRDFPVL